MRIVSLLPSATEIIYLLGLDHELVGVTHSCDVPPEASQKTVVTRPRLASARLRACEIDDRASDAATSGEAQHTLDVDAIVALAPDLIVTQRPCAACAVSHGVVQAALPCLPTTPRVVSLRTTRFAELFDDIKTVGDATGRSRQAHEAIISLRSRLDAVTLKTARALDRPHVCCLEWLDPLSSAGHWVPDMVGLAGGVERLGEAGAPARRIDWEEVEEARPQVVVLMLRGRGLRAALTDFRGTDLPASWERLPAVQADRVWAVDGSAYFNRPGPRLIEGIEILATILHPELFNGSSPADAARRVERRVV
ncbi:MAG: cobalamin-binding protein [Chloroflexi bacterium]|nr:cobalamin-binding protein [Chloroflexota bacterium]